MDRTNKLTALGGTAWGFGGLGARSLIGEADRRRRLLGLRDLGGVCRRLFDVGEGPAEAVAEAKQDSVCLSSGGRTASYRLNSVRKPFQEMARVGQR
jgi:hypothetical protein